MRVLDCYIYRELAVGTAWTDPDRFFHLELERIQELYTPGHTRFFVMSICWEYEFNSEFFARVEGFFARCRHIAPQIKILLILNPWYKTVLGNQSFGADDVFYLDFFLFRVYYELSVKQKSPMLQCWDYQASRVLFLTGKSHRINRVRLLYKLMISEVGSRLNWSLKINDTDTCRGYLNDVSDQEFDWFLTQQRACDRYFSPTGIPYDPDVYRTALFQIVSETNFDRPLVHPSVTEKTWLAIFNCRPFIVAGEIGVLDDLESKGFDVFRNFLSIPNYDNPERSDFLQYSMMSGKQGFVTTGNQRAHWHQFYEIYRDPTWPDRVGFDEIASLPADLQQEIKDNYTAGVESLGELRLDAVVENAVYWTKHISTFYHDISAITARNRSRAMTMGQQLHTDFVNFMTRHGIDFNMDYLVTLYDLPPDQSDVYDMPST